MNQWEREVGRLEFERQRQRELKARVDERLAHLRRRARELLRRLPADLPAEAANMRLIVAALVSDETARLQAEEDAELLKTGYSEPAPGHEPAHS